MKPITYGNSWQGLGNGLTPSLISAMHMTRFYAGLHHYKHSQWVVDSVINTSG